MMTKNSEKLLKAMLNDMTIDDRFRNQIPVNSFPIGVIFRQSPLSSEAETETAFSLLLNSGYVTKIAGPFYKLTAEGCAYFESKTHDRNIWLAEHLYLPILVGFVLGLVTGLVVPILVRLLINQ